MRNMVLHLKAILMSDSPIDPALLARAQVLAAIDAIDKYCEVLLDEGPDNFVAIRYKLIKELEDKRADWLG